MTKNVGKIDRLLRILLGAALFLWPFVTDYALWDSAILKYGAMAVGIILVATSAMKFCPLYRLVGMSTCRR
ncbi:Protein of unknown function [Shimia gijangensis]|uniref:Inner membrane protein YgaP-like transmembrane domain-containing protein n=1 Tax=Shimia gijangensis TaxID=1470563 RepID=A0A1M6B9C6_9RHOB|nr:DUF2892 domain-containing protein [Shimia gijangensis]SHI45178.1 Protein of unknown function [Shimia gijangensis]